MLTSSQSRIKDLFREAHVGTHLVNVWNYGVWIQRNFRNEVGWYCGSFALSSRHTRQHKTINNGRISGMAATKPDDVITIIITLQTVALILNNQ
ncbi:hypothetical protein M8J75_009653 [Diaphorina citri]|nr:hypothetical protein M8J75_009653 [Diaphorina citri]